MKKIIKFLKFCIYTFLLIVVLVLAAIYVGHKFIYPIPFSATTTVPDITEEGFCFGVNCQDAPKTVDGFIPVFANQIKIYNKVAPSLWPDNNVVDLYAAVQSIEHNKSWLISPDGGIKTLTTGELKDLCPVRSRYNIGFVPFKNDTIQGVYLALSEVALKNVLEYQQYQYLGTYDLFLTYSHEMFHSLEQDKVWASPDTIHNRSRNPRLDHFEARIERHLIYKQLLEANSAQSPSERDSLILQVLANYQEYKESYPEDYNAARYYDRIEGTAHYYEIISSLFSAYPEKINSPETLKRALRVLARSRNVRAYEDPGIDSESYVIGAWTGFLLDEVEEDNSRWKTEIMHNPDLTPLDILAQTFKDNPLPPAVKPTQAFEEKVKVSIQEKRDKKVAPGIFRMLYQLIF